MRAHLEDVKEVVRTYEFNPEEWDISVEGPSKKPPRPREPKGKPPTGQRNLF
jgi:hypothetical protein